MNISDKSHKTEFIALSLEFIFVSNSYMYKFQPNCAPDAHFKKTICYHFIEKKKTNKQKNNNKQTKNKQTNAIQIDQWLKVVLLVWQLSLGVNIIEFMGRLNLYHSSYSAVE